MRSSEALLAVLIGTPFIIAILATGLCWRSLRHRVLFFLVSVLSLLGIQQVFVPAAFAILMQSDVGLRGAAHSDGFLRSIVGSTAIEVVAGGLILWWLSRALRKS